MKKVRFFNKIIVAVLLVGVSFGCTDLSEDINSKLPEDLAQETFDAGQLLGTVYNNLQQFGQENEIWALQTHSSDESIAPTRGGDWDDNGQWRGFHTQTTDADHALVRSTFNDLLNGIFNANEVLTFNPSPQQEAEALFLRAFFTFWVNDLFGQVPFREPGEDLLQAPVVLTRAEAVTQMLADLNAALPNLSDGGAPEIATKNAARMLMARVYLNKFIYEGEASPSAADMSQVISLSQDIINSGSFNLLLGNDYYKSFEPAADVSELIFVANYTAGVPSTKGNNVRNKYFSTLHYLQTPGGWNGFTTIADFYDTFTDDNDVRKSASTDYTTMSGVKMGFLIGQQYDGSGTALNDRNGAPLIFTKDVKLIEAGANLEVTGIRVMKWTPDFNNGDNVDIDMPLMRLGEVYVNLAEAYLRNGDSGNALSTVNSLRAARNAAPLGAIDMTSMLNERGYELFWEGLRRTDQIRFGDFNNAWDEKPATDSHVNIYPIPNTALGANPNLTQNPGY
jgi:hypothetical protein